MSGEKEEPTGEACLTGALASALPGDEDQELSVLGLLARLDLATKPHGEGLSTKGLVALLEALEAEFLKALHPSNSPFAVEVPHPALRVLDKAIAGLEGLLAGDKPPKAFERQTWGSAALPQERLAWDDWLLRQVDYVMESKGFRHRTKAEHEVAAVLRKEGVTRNGKLITAKDLTGLRRRRDDRISKKNPRLRRAKGTLD
ncbi:MAG: hypothetical protein IM651_05305 [Phenylobacterium sp.]|nr:hypothetical protein [Phenylobacterium sp.]